MSLQENNLYEFENFHIDLSERTLWYENELIPLAPKVVQTLCVLVENRGQLMTKDKLMDAIWADTFVEEKNLTQNISTLRKVFREKQKGKKFIETQPRRGYRFVADVKTYTNEEFIKKYAGEEQTKEKENKFQSAGDLLIDLKNFRKDLDLKAGFELSMIPDKDTKTAKENGRRLFATNSSENTESGNAETQRKNELTNASSFEYVITQAKNHKFFLAIGAILLLGAVSAIAYFEFFAESGSSKIESIAVMPFVNESENEDVEYLSDGMTETLISSLSNIPDLSIKARVTVFNYKGKEISPKKIGEELNVDAILLGRLVQRGEDVKLNLELVNTTSQDVLWSESYNRNLNDLVSLQSEIARTVSNKLSLKLTTKDQEKVTKTYTAITEAQQLYLKGRFYQFRRGIKNLEKAVEYYKQAIEKDPNYALAYTGLADTYVVMPNIGAFTPGYGNFRPREYMPQARQAVLKALELDENLAEAHKTLGQILLYDYDWEGAEREFKKAIELKPNYETAYLWYGNYLSLIGKQDEAIKEMSKGLKLDPLSFGINRNKGQILRRAKRYDEAIAQMKQLIELFPNNELSHYGLADAFAAKGMYAEAVEHYLIGYRLSKQSPELIQKIEVGYEKGGWKGFIIARLEVSLEEKRTKLKKDKNAFIPSGHYVKFFALLKDKEKTLEYLNKAYEQREINMLFLKDDFYFDFLRDEPKFKKLVNKIGFPE